MTCVTALCSFCKYRLFRKHIYLLALPYNGCTTGESVFDSQQRQTCFFFIVSSSALGPTHPFFPMSTEVLATKIKWTRREVNIDVYLAPRFRMHGAVPPIPILVLCLNKFKVNIIVVFSKGRGQFPSDRRCPRDDVEKPPSLCGGNRIPSVPMICWSFAYTPYIHRVWFTIE